MSRLPEARAGRRIGPSTSAALILAGTLLVGCSTDEAGPNPYAADIALALTNASSDFEREVLADGLITKAEYDEAHSRWLACMRETYPLDGRQQVRLETGPSGIYTGYVLDTPAGVEQDLDHWDATNERCAAGTIAEIAWLYNDMLLNPERLDFDELMIRCLRGKGTVDEHYSVEDFQADWSEWSGETGAITACLEETSGR